MTADMTLARDMRHMVDVERGTVDRRIFYDQQVYELELEQIFARTWNFMCHDTQKYTIPCNWKLAVDNVWDWYHPQLSHASAFMSGFTGQRRSRPGDPAAQPAPQPPAPRGNPLTTALQRTHRVILGDYGHGISGPKLVPGAPDPNYDDTWREKPEAQKALGPVGLQTRGHPHIFPNLWFATGPGQLSLRLPKGPFSTEVWWFTILPKTEDTERFKDQSLRAMRVFGPAGMLEQDDGENWEQSTKGMAGTAARNFPINYQMGLNHGEIIKDEDGPGYIDTKVNEHAQLWLYRAWSEWMSAESWDDLRVNHSPSPDTTV